MKILLTNKFFFRKGGAETVFFQELYFLKSQGIDVVDFSMKDKKNIESKYSSSFISNVDYQNFNGILDKIKKGISFIHSREAVAKIDDLLTQEKPDIAHLHNIYHQLTPSIIPILKKHGIKVVLTLHDYKLICPSYIASNNGKICNACKGKFFWKPFTSNCQNSFMRGFLLSAEAMFHKWKKSYEDVDLFLAPSQFMADQISQRVPSEKIQVLHNGIDIEKYQPLYDDRGYGLFFGRLSKEKGIETLLKAHKILSNPFPLKIVGTGPMENILHKKYSDVEFLGYKSGQELNTLIANSAFVVIPSEWYENCSMTALESMAYGKPIIGSRIGGMPEQIEDGKTGFLFEMGNTEDLSKKMGLLIIDEALRQQLGKNARGKLENEYSLNKHCKKLETIYKKIFK